MSRYLPCLLLLTVGCSTESPAGPKPKQGPMATNPTPKPPGSPPITPRLSPEEEAVKAFLLRTAGDPNSVEFVRWGPNLLGKDVPPGKGIQGVVRVCYRAKNDHDVKAYHDRVFPIAEGGKILASPASLRSGEHENPHGDRWAEFVKAMSR